MTENKNQNSSFLKSYIKGEAFYGFWGIASNILTLINAFLIISHLDIFRYGSYLLVLAFYSLVAGFLLRPLYDVIINDILRFMTEGKEDQAKKLYWESFISRTITSLIAFVVVFFGANVVAKYYGYDIANLLKYISFLFIVDSLYTSMRIIFRIRMKFGIISFRSVLNKFLKMIFLFSFIIFFKLGMEEAIISYVIATFLSTIIFIPLFVKAYSPWKKIKAASGSVMFKIIKMHGKWSLFSQLISRATNDIRPWLIKFFINTEAVAIYSVAESLLGAVKTFFPVATLSALIPGELLDKRRSGDILLRGTKYLAIYGFVLGIASFIFLPPIIKYVFPQYVESIDLFKVLLIILPILSFRSMSMNFLVALRRQKFLFFVNLLQVVAILVLSMLFLHWFGIWGMVFQRISIMVIIGGVMYFYLLKKEVPFNYWKKLFIFDDQDKIFVKNLWVRSKGYLSRKTIFKK